MIKRYYLLFMAILMIAFGGAFTVEIQAATFTVSIVADSGSGSLRQAITDANAASSDDTILFDSALSGQTIVLASEIPMNNNGTLTINGANVLTIDGNAGTRIFYSNGATVTIIGITLKGGNGAGAVAAGGGGAIYASGGTLILDSVHVTANTVTGKGAGAFFSGGTNHQILNSTFSVNTAVDCGGFYNSGGTLNVTNSTISGNKATDAISEIASGGGFCSSGDTALRSVTVTGNSADDFGGGIEIENGTLNLGDTIVAGNTAGTAFPDIRRLSGAMTTAGYNLIGNNQGIDEYFPAGNPNVNNDIVGASNAPIDPLLDTLKNNGGAPPTHELLTGSPAIDKAGSFGTSTDQRGLIRPVDSPDIANAADGVGGDIGAFENQFAPTAAAVTIGGRVLTAGGRAVSRVKITLTDQHGAVRQTTTNPFGYYRFSDVSTGETFVINAVHKQYRFVSQVLSVNGNLSSVNLIAEN